MPPTPNSRIPTFLVRSDVVDLNRHSFLLLICHTKTIQFGQRLLTLPFVSCPDVRLCPVTFLFKHLVGSPLPATEPLFSYCRNGRVFVLTHASFVSRLKICLTRAGFPPECYSGHSFRRGGGGAPFALLREWGSLILS